MFTCLDILI